MHMRTSHIVTSSVVSIGLGISLVAAELSVSHGYQNSFSITAEKIVRIQTPSGATALVQFTAFGPGAAASYHWRYRASSSEPIKSGMGQVRESYNIIPNADGRYSPLRDHNTTFRAGDICIEWSYGSRSMSWLYYNTNSASIQILSTNAFGKDF